MFKPLQFFSGASAMPDWASEDGEGVISAAIAVLVIAFLGVAMWLGFSEVLGSATERVNDQIEQIGAR